MPNCALSAHWGDIWVDWCQLRCWVVTVVWLCLKNKLEEDVQSTRENTPNPTPSLTFPEKEMNMEIYPAKIKENNKV